MATPKLKRPLTEQNPRLEGRDVKMVQRALNKWAHPSVALPITSRYESRTADRMLAFQLEQHISPASGKFGDRSLEKLWPYFDAYGRLGYRTFVPPKIPTQQELAFDKLLAAMKLLDANSQGYILGAGHGTPLEELDADNFFDCSSSCSYVLKRAGMFDGTIALVSGDFVDRWGAAGPGKTFTVYANGEHVWIRLYKTRWWRFDTSPHVDGRPSENPRRGPRLRFFPRFSSSFTTRHWPGM